MMWAAGVPLLEAQTGGALSLARLTWLRESFDLLEELVWSSSYREELLEQSQKDSKEFSNWHEKPSYTRFRQIEAFFPTSES